MEYNNEEYYHNVRYYKNKEMQNVQEPKDTLLRWDFWACWWIRL